MIFRPLAAALAIPVAALCAATSFAQSPAAGRANAIPPVDYRSALEGYQPFTEQTVAPWQQSNDTVRAVGGWRAYARESRPPAGPAAAASAPSSPASAPGANDKP
jgi:hypothetical protein